MLGRVLRLGGCGSAVLVSAIHCSVFPDRAVLPVVSEPGAAGTTSSAGEPSITSGAGENGGPSVPVGGAAMGGAGGHRVAGAAGDGGDELGPVVGGAGGASGDCVTPREITLPITFDTYIDQAEPRTSYATARSLLVRGAPDERRLLLNLALPSESTSLTRALLSLRVEQNADVSEGARVLGLHQLTREIGTSTSWRNYSNKKWDNEGGDFGPEIARATLPAGATRGPFTFDVTDLVRAAIAAEPTGPSVVVLETGPAPVSPSDLAFTSLEGNASEAPALLLSYCEP